MLPESLEFLQFLDTSIEILDHVYLPWFDYETPLKQWPPSSRASTPQTKEADVIPFKGRGGNTGRT